MDRQETSSHWDAIIIGSGIGGLIVGGLLAKVHRQKVLLVERHSKLGGFTHGFLRKAKYKFDIGVHYIGELEEDSDLRTLFAYLTSDKLEWTRLPHEYDRLIFDDFEWNVPSSREEHKERLKKRFPAEEGAIEKYFHEEKKISDAYGLWQYSEKFFPLLRSLVRAFLKIKHPNMFLRTNVCFDKFFQNKELKQILQARWMGFGVPPDQSAFGMHCLHAIHYSQGAWYPVGGGQMIADLIAPTISQAGGKILTKTAVTEILTKENSVVGVQLGNGERAYSSVVISNVGARKTYLDLLPKKNPLSFRRQLAESPVGASLISLFMGLKKSPRELGFEPVNYWFCPGEQGEVLNPANYQGEPFWGFLSFPSLKMGDRHHTAQVIILSDHEIFKKWADSRWRRRPQDYEDYKEYLSKKIMEDLEGRFPGFSAQVDYLELSTPLSVEHFHGAPGGAVYGVPSTPERFSLPWAAARTPIKGLYLTGSDTFSPGISGAIHGALKTFDIVCQKKKFSRTR